MARMAFCSRNYADAAVLSGGSWLAGLPLANLQDRQLWRVARSADADPSSTVIAADFGLLRPIAYAGLLAHSLTQSGRVRLRLGPSAGMTDAVYDSGWMDIWPAVYPFGVGVWGEFNWGGKLSVEEASTYGIAWHHPLPAGVLARHMRLDLDDAGNPAGHVQAGRLIAGPLYTPSRNLRYGWHLQQVDPSRVSYSRGGQAYVELLPRYRRLALELALLPTDEAYGHLYEMQRRLGVAGDLVVMRDPDDTLHRHRETIYGRLSRLEPIVQQVHGRHGLRIEIEELI